MALGFGSVLLWGAARPDVRHIVDVEGGASMHGKFLGFVPDVGKGRGQAHDAETQERVAMGDYCIHHVRTMLQLRSADHRTLATLTSPSPGDGKSTLGLALAVSFAGTGSRTLLIDFDLVGHGTSCAARTLVCEGAMTSLATPGQGGQDEEHERQPNAPRCSPMRSVMSSQTKVFSDAEVAELMNIHRARGEEGDEAAARIAQALETVERARAKPAVHGLHRGIVGVLDGRRLEECVVTTQIPNLSVLPVGDGSAFDAERISGAAFDRLIEICRQQYDTVLIDTGPVLGSIEAAYAIAATRDVVLVVSRGCRRPLVDEAMQRIERIGGRVAGVVFNRAGESDVARSSYASQSRSRAFEAV
jgi:Mrp family chromosome partitioning ATPase